MIRVKTMKLSITMLALVLVVNSSMAQKNEPDARVQRDEEGLPHYEPQPVALPKSARYLMSDGSIAVVGYNDMDSIFANLNALFIQSHPGFKFTMTLKGTATAAPALTHGVSAFAPMGAEFSALEMASYKSIVGEEPLMFRVAHCSLNPLAKSGPVGIFVNHANPLDKLTLDQVTRIFTTGSIGGDLTNWRQLGLEGLWANRPIHPYGIAEEAAAGLANVMLKKMGGHPFTPSYDSFPQSVEVIKRVGEDPAGIGFASGNLSSPEVKLLAIGKRADGYYSLTTTEDIIAGKYPFDRYLLIYVRRTDPFDPFVKEYLRMILSCEGQQAIAAAAPGYLPLNAREVAVELAKLR